MTALGGASLASNAPAGPPRVAIGWATVLIAIAFLMFSRFQRSTSLRLARTDHARRRDSLRLREELAEAHLRSRLAVERSYAAVARSEVLAAEVSRLIAVLAAAPPPTVQYVTLPATGPAPTAHEAVAAVEPSVEPSVEPTPEPRLEPAVRPAPVAPAARADDRNFGTEFDLPLVAKPAAASPPAVPIAPRREAPFVSPASPVPAADPRIGASSASETPRSGQPVVPIAPRRAAPFAAPSAPTKEQRNRVDLRAVESNDQFAQGA